MSDRLQKAIRELPPELEEEVADFAEFVTRKKTVWANAEPPRKMDLSWIGSASSLKDQYKSGVEAAHDALKIWGDMVEGSLKK